MKSKLNIIFTIVLILIIILCVVGLVNNRNTFGAYQGKIPGTGFIIQEIPGAGSTYYDVDSQGKIYFAIQTAAIVIYDNDGMYLYTLPIDMNGGGTLFVKIDDNNNIMVCDAKAEAVNIYNQNGQLINTIDDKENILYREFAYNYHDIHIREKPNGVVYNNVDGTITKTENGETIVVFTIPEWQQLDSLYIMILVIAIIAFTVIYILKFAKWQKKNDENSYGNRGDGSCGCLTICK